MIEVKNIVKSFDGRTVLHNVDATFYTGKTNLIIGQSGSGKTVLMKSLVGLITPEEGQILFDGRNLLTMNKDEVKNLRKEIGMLFQGSALF
ncbi:MAG: ATP-binding cassette domain-containing protein, partial [Muribaculaceae bacterium]|nr:ATP-binding cassette domain-containing protein [Muribaculaceae bacterium]